VVELEWTLLFGINLGSGVELVSHEIPVGDVAMDYSCVYKRPSPNKSTVIGNTFSGDACASTSYEYKSQQTSSLPTLWRRKKGQTLADRLKRRNRNVGRRFARKSE